MLDRRILEDLLNKATQNFYGLGYDLDSMSKTERRPQTLYIKAAKAGLSYEVLDPSNKLVSAVISWNKLQGFPRKTSEIIKAGDKCLLWLLQLTFAVGHTQPVNKITEFEEGLVDTLKMTTPMTAWTLEHFLCMAVPLQAQHTLIDRLKAKRLIPTEYTFYLVSDDAMVEGCDLRVMPTVPTLVDLPSGNNNSYVLVQEAPGSSPSALYFIDRRFSVASVAPMVFVGNSDISSIISLLFPMSKGEVYSDIFNLTAEQLNQITSLTGHSLIVKGRIYLQSDKQPKAIKYTIRYAPEEIITGLITEKELGQKLPLPLTQEILNSISAEILSVIFRRGHAHSSPNNQMNYTMAYKSVNRPEDIKQAVREMMRDFDQALKYFLSQEAVKLRNAVMPPVKWLEQCGGAGYMLGTYDVHSSLIGYKQEIRPPRIMETIILTDHYGLDMGKVLNKKEDIDARRCKIGTAAEILGVDEESVISECVKRGVGVYLKGGDYKIVPHLHYPNSTLLVNENKNKKKSYDYPYKGLARLADSSLGYFLESDFIRCQRKEEFKFVHLQLSMSELMHGVRMAHIQLRPGQTISREECIFIEEELIGSGVVPVKDRGDTQEVLAIPKTRKHLLKPVLKAAYLGEKVRIGREPTATEVWDALRAEPHVSSSQLSLNDALPPEQEPPAPKYDLDEIIQEMDDRKLGWRNRKGDDKTLKFSSFETKLGKIKKAI